VVVFFALDGDGELFVAALTAGSAAGGIAYGGQAKPMVVVAGQADCKRHGQHGRAWDEVGSKSLGSSVNG